MIRFDQKTSFFKYQGNPGNEVGLLRMTDKSSADKYVIQYHGIGHCGIARKIARC